MHSDPANPLHLFKPEATSAGLETFVPEPHAEPPSHKLVSMDNRPIMDMVFPVIAWLVAIVLVAAIYFAVN